MAEVESLQLTSRTVVGTVTRMDTTSALAASSVCSLASSTSATSSSHSTSIALTQTTPSVAAPCVIPSTLPTPGGMSGTEGSKCPVTNSAPNSMSNRFVSTSSVSVPNSDIITSHAAKEVTTSVSASGKVSKMTLNNSVADTTYSLTSTALSSAAATDQSPAATDLDQTGDNPHKLLQAVRSTTLPFPLPVPTYSQAVQAARASGNVLTERATIIRETVKFFLNHKYWWTSEDYDRIAELVVNEFPELRDTVVWPATPCYSKVRLDLSMCARNIRRIAKNQEKRRGSPGRLSTESAEMAADPVAKPRKGGSKGGGKSSRPISMSSPTMVTVQPAGQMLPHTAHTAHTPAATTATLQDQKQISGLPYMLTSTAPTTSSSTVLPPVAHFLGHSAAASHSPGGIVFPSLLPATLSLSTADTTSATLSTPVESLSSSQPMGAGSLAVAPLAGRQDGYVESPASLAAAWRPDAQLPDPLPVPPYSDKVMKAKKIGVTKYERPLIIRETVLFFLSLKYWWSSVDYDRISDFLVDYFPDLKDPMLSPNMPPNRRVRTDLSQTARNIRRREVMLRRRDSRSPEERFTAVGTVSVPTHSVQQPSTDFCNELLAAASIIESRTAALHQKDVAKALELHTDDSRELEANTDVITPTHTAKLSEPLKSALGGTKTTSESVSVSKEQMSEAAKYPYSYTAVSEGMDQHLGPTEGAVLNSQLAVVKQEVGEEESQLDQYQALQAQAQASQAWFSAQMSQALSMQALTGLGAQMSQALSVAQISEQLMSSQASTRPPASQPSTPPAAHQSAGAGGGASTGSQGQATLSLQQLSQTGGYNLPTSTSLLDSSPVDSTHVDRMSAMAMWRSTCLPDPLPTPPYSLNVLRARDSGNTASARPRIIRETTQFFLSMKMWWTTQDYERIAELVLRQFPALKTVQNIKKDLGTCARNMRRRLPLSRNKQWVGYQSPPHNVLKEGDGLGEAGALTLGELATMASLREAQDKSRAEAAGLAALTEEQRQTLLAHSVYEQNTLAWNALYQQQFSTPAETAPMLSQARSTKRSLSDTTGGKGIEAAERELAEALKQAALEQSVKQFGDTESSRRHSVDVSDGIKVREMKKETAGKVGQRTVSCEASKADSHPMMKELISHPSLSSREQKRASTESAAFHHAQTPLMAPMTEGLVHAHQAPVRAHSQSGSQVRSDPSSVEEEVPMNLTCSSEVSKQPKVQKHVKSEPKDCQNDSSNMETFSAREQVWFPHGSPWKKSGQDVFKALPNPLPVPKYSHKLIKAHEEGLAYRHRSEIIRETARFFLGFKYWWSSADYSRISELVVLQFPELKDPVSHPGQPCYRRVQRDLSMCARNLRRKNTRRQQLSAGESTPSTPPKKMKASGSKDKKTRKDGDSKKGMTSDYSAGKETANRAQSDHSQAVAAVAAAAASSLAHAMFQATSDPGPVPSISHPLAIAHGSSLPGEDKKWASSTLEGVHTTGGPVFPHLTPSDGSGTPTASVPVSTPRVNHHSELSMVSKTPQPGPEKESSMKQASVSGKGAAKREAGAPHSNHKSSSIKSVKSVAPSTHRSQQQKEGQGASTAVLQSTSGHKIGNTKDNKDRGHRSQLTSSHSSHSDARALSNTTAIVTPTLSEAHSSAESRNTEGTVSAKVYINPEHGSELQTQLTKLWQEGKFFDASLEVDDYRLPVHKLVLLAASPYLQSTFRHANPTSHLEVNLPRDTGIGAARDFLKYIYEGVLHVAPDTVSALRRIAAMLQIDQLLTYCDDYISHLTTTSTTSLSHHSTLPHNAPLVSRVSVNLRDPAHTHALATDHRNMGLPNQTLELSNGLSSSMSIGAGTQYGQGEASSSRKRGLSALVTGQSYHTQYGVETLGEREKAHAVQAPTGLCERQEELQVEVPLAKRLQPSGDAASEQEAMTNMVLSQQGGLTYHAVVEDQQLHLVEDCTLMEPFTADKLPCRSHGSSVIQRGPNAISAPAQVLSQSGQTDSSVEDQAVVHFLPGSGEDRQLAEDSLTSSQSELTEDNVMVTLLPQTDVEVEVREEMEVEPVQNLTHLSGEEEQVVEEVVVHTGDLLQDVEVAACETVECSLLPQTYCSSPEDCHTLASHTDSALQSMASQWAAQQYAEAPLDAATAQQFVAVLQERMYGHSGSPSNQDQQGREAGYEQQQDVYMQQCADNSTVFVTTQPQSTAHELVIETSAMIDSPNEQVSAEGQASLLPQTYCSSPRPHSPPVGAH